MGEKHHFEAELDKLEDNEVEEKPIEKDGVEMDDGGQDIG